MHTLHNNRLRSTIHILLSFYFSNVYLSNLNVYLRVFVLLSFFLLSTRCLLSELYNNADSQSNNNTLKLYLDIFYVNNMYIFIISLLILWNEDHYFQIIQHNIFTDARYFTDLATLRLEYFRFSRIVKI